MSPATAATGSISTVSVNTVSDVKTRVDALVSTLRERARDTELQRGMLPENLRDLTDAGAFRLTLPKDRGGFEADVASINEILAQISRGDPSSGWIVSLINAMNTWAALVADEAAEELLATPDLRISGLIAPTGKAQTVEGGVRVSGTWMWNTAGKHSNWVALACMLPAADGPEPVVCLVPTSEVTVHDTWDAFGMAGTATNKITAADVFVPSARIIAVRSLGSGEFVPRRYSDNPYYNRPAVQLFLAISAGPVLGIARGAMDVFLDRLPGRAITYTSYPNQVEAPITHLQVAEAQHALEIAEMYTQRINELMDAGLGTTPTVADRIRTRAYLGQVTTYARKCATILFEASGASAVQHEVQIQRYFRDIHALAMHAAQQPNSALELYGRFLVGLEPNSTLL
jgi:3-hydroxy-9,10-secoandrosta-1,3,5(10)-triene-9,17-dione monooxygenase